MPLGIWGSIDHLGYICIHAGVYVRMYIHVYVYVCVYIYRYMYIGMCGYMCVYVCVYIYDILTLRIHTHSSAPLPPHHTHSSSSRYIRKGR